MGTVLLVARSLAVYGGTAAVLLFLAHRFVLPLPRRTALWLPGAAPPLRRRRPPPLPRPSSPPRPRLRPDRQPLQRLSVRGASRRARGAARPDSASRRRGVPADPVARGRARGDRRGPTAALESAHSGGRTASPPRPRRG